MQDYAGCLPRQMSVDKCVFCFFSGVFRPAEPLLLIGNRRIAPVVIFSQKIVLNGSIWKSNFRAVCSVKNGGNGVNGMFANPKEIQLLPMNSWKSSLSASPTLEMIFWLYKNPCPKTFRSKFTPEKGSQTIGIPFCKQYKRAFPSHQPGVNNAAVLRFRRIMVNPARSIQVHGCRRDIETTWCVSRIFLYHSRATSADPCIPHKPPYDCYRNKTPI